MKTSKRTIRTALRALFTAGAIILVFTACTGSPAAAGAGEVSSEAKPTVAAAADELNTALRETSDYLNRRLDRGIKAVFLNFKSDYPDLSEYVINRLIENTVNDGVFTAVDRQNLALIQQEMDFQLSGEVSDNTAQSIGQKLGAQIIVSGSILPLGDEYLLTVRAIGVEGADIRGQFSRDIPNGSRIAALTRNRAAPVPTGSSAPAARTGGQAAQTAPAITTGANGTYTFFPRPRSMQGGVDMNLYLDRITIRGGYLTLFFTGSPSGRGGDGDYRPFWEMSRTQLKDLDNPARTWNPVSPGEDADVTGGDYLTSQSAAPARFSLTGNNATLAHVFEEIILGEPD
jgi:hypothetical protein